MKPDQLHWKRNRHNNLDDRGKRILSAWDVPAPCPEYVWFSWSQNAIYPDVCDAVGKFH